MKLQIQIQFYKPKLVTLVMSLKVANLLLAGCLLATLTYSNARKIELENRIMRGIKGNVRDMPWVVSFFQYTPKVHTFGSGLIVHKKWVLTAGHVLYSDYK
jgi:secreted trypsin-like serine protease